MGRARAIRSWRGENKGTVRVGRKGASAGLGWAGSVSLKTQKKKKLDCWENVRPSDFQPFGLEQKIRLGNTLIEENNDLGKSAETETKQKIEKMFGTMNPTNSFYGQ